MTRNECENKIAEKIIEIAEIYNQYNPQDEYLSMSIQGNYINVNNSCFEENYNGGKISFILFDYKKDKGCIIMTTRDFSDSQEKHIAKVTGGKVQSNSGGTKFGGGDVHTDKFLIEAKTPTRAKSSYSIKAETLNKMYEQAFEQGKECGVLAFRFHPNGNDFYILSERQFLEYLRYKEMKV